jgi:transcriptional regulator with GAF, ATPase, and Fis domain
MASASNPNVQTPASKEPIPAFDRYPLGMPQLGVVVESAQPIRRLTVDSDEEWIVYPEWVEEEGIQNYAAQPLQFRGETLGVLEVWDRTILSDEDFVWLRVCADQAAVSIVNARAFEEIASLKERLEQENDYLREEVNEALGHHNIIGASPGIRKVLQQIQLVAPTDASVLISGESGTGKELVARAIHENSPRKGRALIKVNCGAIPENLFESEFFGHKRGAFTGAVQDRLGRFELADGGTLFLDEIGEVPLAMQAKLLRVLQEQEIEPVGDSKTRKIDVRIVAATNRDLKKEAAAGRFRQDLFYRLSVFPLEIPPLRERRQDIAPLASNFLRLTAKKMNLPLPRLTKVQAELLAAHDWPGNVRELQNTIERAMILGQGTKLDLESLSSPNPNVVRESESPTRGNSAPMMTRDDWKRMEKELIKTALERSEGKVFGNSGAAEILKMNPTTLLSRMKALGLKSKVSA